MVGRVPEQRIVGACHRLDVVDVSAALHAHQKAGSEASDAKRIVLAVLPGVGRPSRVIAALCCASTEKVITLHISSPALLGLCLVCLTLS